MAGQSLWAGNARAADEASVVADDTFTRTVASGWGSANPGGEWRLIPEEGASVDGGSGKLLVPQGGTRTATIGGSLSEAVQVQTSFVLPKPPVGGDVTLAAMLNSSGTSFYEARIRVEQTGDAFLSLVSHRSAGSRWLLSREVLLGSVANGRKVFLVAASNPNGRGIVFAKAWVEGAAVPTAWQVDGKDDAVPLSGGAGLITAATSQTSETEVLVDDFRLTTGSVTQPPVAAFTVAATDLLVTFDGSTSTDPDGQIVSWDWDLGDGTSAKGPRPAPKLYPREGTYVVSLTVADDQGAITTAYQEVTVARANAQPVAVFTAAADGANATFDASQSTDDGQIVEYEWDFGDGNTGSGSSTAHIYSAPGTYQVTLTVTDDRGAQASSVQPLVVVVNLPPTATITSAGRGLTYLFSAAQSVDPDGQILSYRWDFGGGNTSDFERPPLYTFPAAGTYPVSLTVTDDKGLSDTKVEQFVVQDISTQVVRPGAQLPVLFDLSSLPGRARFVAPNGSDTSGDGTLAKPYASLKRAVSASSAGDSVVLRGGTYTIDGIVSIGKADLTITAYPGEVPIFDGSIPAPTTAVTDGSLKAFDYLPMPAMPGEGLSLDQLPKATFNSAGQPTGLAASRGWRCVTTGGSLVRDESVNLDHDSPQTGTRYPGVDPLAAASGCPSGTVPRVITGFYPDQAWVGGKRLVQVLKKSLVKPGTFYVDRSASSDQQPSMSQMFLSAQDAADLSQVSVSSSNGNFLHFAADGITLRGLKIVRHSPAWPYFALTVTEGIDRSRVQDVKFEDVASIATKFAGGAASNQSQLGKENTFQRVSISNPGWMGTSVMYQTNVSFLDSEYSDANPDDEFETAPKSGAIKVTKTHGFKLVGSNLLHTGGNGLWFDQSNYNSTIANSTIRNSSGSQVVYEISHGLTMVNNLITHHGQSGDTRPTVRIAGSSGTKLVNNTIVDGPVPLAFATDERGSSYGSNRRPCSEHTLRYGQGGDFSGVCPPGLASDLDKARPGAFGESNLTPELDWRVQADLLVNNVIANPRTSSGQVCPGGYALCVNGSAGKFVLPTNQIFPRGLVMDGNVYQAPNGVAQVRVPTGQQGAFTAGTLSALKGGSGFGSSFYGLSVEQHGLDGAGWVNQQGQPTAALQARQGQAAPVPADPTINTYVPAGSRAYGYTPVEGSSGDSNQYPNGVIETTVVGRTVTFDASASTDPDGTIRAYLWGFGDGSVRQLGKTVTHTYDDYGSYTIALLVLDDQGRIDVESKTIEVVDPAQEFTVRDSFIRTQASGWGEASVGGAWTLSGSANNYFVDGTSGVMKLAPGQSRRALLNAPSSEASDVYGIVRYSDALSGNGVYLSVMPRANADGSGYRAKVTFSGDGSASLQLSRVNSSGQETIIKNSSTRITGIEPDSSIWIRVQAVGKSPTTLRANIWLFGALAPETWQVEATDNTSGLQRAAGVGVYAYQSGSAASPVNLRIDEIAVLPPLPAAP